MGSVYSEREAGSGRSSLVCRSRIGVRGEAVGRPEKPLSSSASPIVAFARDLRQLRASAGNPSYRRLARTALFSPSVLSSAASGYRLPTLQVTLAFVEACGGDRTEWERRWLALRVPVNPPGQEPNGPRVAAGAGTPAPPTVSPAHLPIGPRHFVARTMELVKASSMMSPSATGRPPLVISGPVGVGKTAFALRLAYDCARDFPDGQLYADMGVDNPAGTSPFDVIVGFLAALGVPPATMPTSDMQRVGLLRSMLARLRVIVLLDDVRNEGQVRPLLSRSMHSQILITSRARLLGLDGVRRTELDVFTRGESLELLRCLVGDEQMCTEREALVRLAKLCDDLPLALTIAGRKIAGQPAQSVIELTRRLAEGTNPARWLRVGDLSLSDALMSAYLRLTPTARRVFHRLNRWAAEGATARDLARSMRIAVESAEHALEELTDCGLLRLTSLGRYAMAPLAVRFAESRLDRQPESSGLADLSADCDAIVPFAARSRAG
jgi:hypothetical protein